MILVRPAGLGEARHQFFRPSSDAKKALISAAPIRHNGFDAILMDMPLFRGFDFRRMSLRDDCPEKMKSHASNHFGPDEVEFEQTR